MESESELYRTARLSTNFGYLAARDPLLFLLGAYAEAYVYKDPMASMGKARQFAERLTELVWAAFGLPGKPGSLSQRVQALLARGAISDVVAGLLTDVRLTGNRAVHDNLDDKGAALGLVRICYELGVWFERTVADDPQPPPFVPPALPDDEHETAAEQLRVQLNAYQAELVGVRFTLDEQSAKFDEHSEWARAEARAQSAVTREIAEALAGQAELRETIAALTAQVSQLIATQAGDVGSPASPLDTTALVSRAKASSDRLLAGKLWHLALVLRNAGVPMVEYVDQLSLLLLLKIADEQSQAGTPRPVVPHHLGWQTLRSLDEETLVWQYEHIVRELVQLGDPFTAFAKIPRTIRQPRALHALVGLIDRHTWWVPDATDARIDGAYDAFLEHVAADARSGTGQYFTPRPLIDTVVECAAPAPHDTVVDPACGSGGFLISAYEYIQRRYRNRMASHEVEHVADGGITGIEISAGTALLARMNMHLHGLGRVAGSDLVEVRDALATRPPRRASLVLSSLPFGTRALREPESAAVQGFWAVTKNNNLNWVQYVYSLLRLGGRAAIIVPDNVLFADGAGEVVRRGLLHECDVHTVLRLPPGIFYAAGVRANVLFFDKTGPLGTFPGTRQLWAYDLRSCGPFNKTNPLRHSDLADFIKAYKPGEPRALRIESDNFRVFSHDELSSRPHFNLDVL